MPIKAEQITIDVPTEAYSVHFTGDNATELEELVSYFKQPDIQSLINLALEELRKKKDK